METTSGKQPSSISNPNCQYQDRATVKKIIDSYKNDPSALTIKESLLPDLLSFDLTPASKEDKKIIKIIKSLNTNKATGSDGRLLQLIKLSANIVDKYLTSIANHIL